MRRPQKQSVGGRLPDEGRDVEVCVSQSECGFLEQNYVNSPSLLIPTLLVGWLEMLFGVITGGLNTTNCATLPDRGLALWSKVLGEYAIVSVKAAKSFRHALRHAIKYPAASWKYFSASPERLASLEKAFYTVKRFHTVGAFYNPPKDPKVPPTIIASYDKCPTCGSHLVEIANPRYLTLNELMRMGSRDFRAWQRDQRLLGNAAVSTGPGPP